MKKDERNRTATLGWTLGLSTLAGLAGLSTGCNKAHDEKPNVLVILTDDQGYGDLACEGNPWIRTPNMDSLYRQSVRLTNFHVSPTSAPTRSALLTGRFNDRTGVWHTVTGRTLMRENEKTMAQLFREQGYATGMFGKWHLGDNYPGRPVDKGFEEAVWLSGGGIGNTDDYWDNDYFDDTYRHDGQFEKYEGYCTDVWFDLATKFIEKHRKEPFFCYLATNAAHWPYYVEDKYSDPYRSDTLIPNPNFYGMITNIDENLGRLRARLRELGIDRNTILVFLTDNGTAAGIRLDGHWRDGFPTPYGYNAGMRGIKASPYDGGHRVPCFIYYPDGRLEGGKDFNGLSAHIDILPTLADLCHIRPDPSWKIDGTDLTGYLTGKAGWNFGNRKLVVDSQRKEVPQPGRLCAVMTDDWRWVNRTELYNMKSDPGQRNNVAELYPEIARELDDYYANWYKDVFSDWQTESYIILGTDKDSTIVLSSHDWSGCIRADGSPAVNEDGEETPVWNHMSVRGGAQLNGYWNLKVVRKGTWRFELRRWPKEAGTPIRGGIAASTIPIPGGKPFGPGRALDIRTARIQIGNFDQTIAVDDEMKGAIFEVTLEPGEYRLWTWFEGPETKLGAYYVYPGTGDQ